MCISSLLIEFATMHTILWLNHQQRYWSFTKHMLIQSQRMSTTPAAGVVDALDPDATSKSELQMMRATRGACNSYMRIYALAVSKGPSNFVDAPISHGEPPAYGVCFCLDGIHRSYRRDGKRRRSHEQPRLVRKQTPKTMEIDVHPRRPQFKPTKPLYAAPCSDSPQTFPILRSACKTWEDHLRSSKLLLLRLVLRLSIIWSWKSERLDIFAGGLNDGVYGPGMEEYV
ncbi:hypothetical protein F5887DRAFT_1290487, partial [Amanita rubescens]